MHHFNNYCNLYLITVIKMGMLKNNKNGLTKQDLHCHKEVILKCKYIINKGSNKKRFTMP